MEQQALEYVSDCLAPRAEAFESSIATHLLEKPFFAEMDFSGLLRGDSAARTARYQSGILSGWMTRNEARLAEGLNPLDGLDEPMHPLNMAEQGRQAPQPNQAPGAYAGYLDTTV